MISILSVDRVLEEQELIRQSCRDQISCYSDETMNFIPVDNGGDPQAGLASLPQGAVLDILYYEIQTKTDVEQLRELRRREEDALLVLLTAPGVSPMLYLKPHIAPSLLLQRPLGRDAVKQAGEELFQVFFEDRSQADRQQEEEIFSVKVQESLLRFRCRDISFFEASNKKINMRVGSEEYEFYDSIEKLARQLPDYIVRCHRSYLVNVHQIRQVILAENVVVLNSGAVVPLSRTYRSEIKERMK